MKLIVNGKEKSFDSDLTVTELLSELGIAAERVVVEVNLTILKRAQHPETRLNEGDRIEIVQFVGGG